MKNPRKNEQERQHYISYNSGRFRKPPFPRKSSKYDIFLCVRARAGACVCVGGHFGVYVCMRACSLTQHVNRFCRIIVISIASLAPPKFSPLSHKRHDFRGKKLLNIKLCFDFLYNFILKYFSF